MNKLVVLAKDSLSKAGFALSQHSPEILIVAGTVGTITATVMACKATLKAQDIIDKNKEKIAYVKEALELEDPDYTEKEAKREMGEIHIQTGVEFAKLYGPSVALLVLSLGTVFASNNILRKRNASLAAAYTTIETAFRRYRKNVVERYGEDVDTELRHNVKRVTIQETETDAKGKEKTVNKEISVVDGEVEGHSAYARFFDERSREWEKSAEYNLSFLVNSQNYANDLVNARGHLFLNEVYDMLDIPRTEAGQIMGWKKQTGEGASVAPVNFGIYEYKRANQRFVNGYENVILLDFNVDPKPIIKTFNK